MMNKRAHWVAYEKRGVEYVHVSKRFDTKQEAEKARERLHRKSKSRRKALGVGFRPMQHPQVYGVPPAIFPSHLGRSTPFKSSQTVKSNNPGITDARSQPD